MVGIHHRVAFRLTGDQPRKVLDGIWVYPPLAKVKAEACLHEVSTDGTPQNTFFKGDRRRSVPDWWKRRQGQVHKLQ